MAEFNASFFRNFYSETLFVTRDANANVPLPEEELLQTGPEIFYDKTKFKGLLILVSEDEKTFAGILQNEFLTKILKAIRFNINEVAFINVTGGPLNLVVVQRKLEFESVISFGRSLIELENRPATYTPLKIGNRSVIISESLHALGVNTALKSQLWNGLQKMFLDR